MDDKYSDTLWNDVTSRSKLRLKQGLEQETIREHQIPGGIPDNIGLQSLFSSLSGKCVRTFYLKQFGFLEDHIRPSEMYRVNREIELLQEQLTRDSEFRKQFFGNYLRSTGKNNKKVVRQLLNHNIPFIIQKIRDRTPTFTNLTDMTLSDWNNDIKPRIAGDKSIKYGAKKMLMKLFPHPVTYADLKEWGIEPPVVDIVMPVQYYRKYHFKTWVTGRNDKGEQLDQVFFLNGIPGGDTLEATLDKLTDSEEWRGYHEFLYDTDSTQSTKNNGERCKISKSDKPKDFRTTRQREDDREEEKIDLAMFFRQVINYQLGKCREALADYNYSKDEIKHISQGEIGQREKNREMYQKLNKAVFDMHTKHKFDNNFSRIQRAGRKTYYNWAQTFDIPFEVIDNWKADQDNTEDERRESVGVDLTNANLKIGNVGENNGAYHLLFTLEDQLNKQLTQVDEIFRQKTGYAHPVEYLNDMANNASFNDTLQSIINKRSVIAAQLGIVQDRIQAIEGGYKTGSLAHKEVSGNTFIKQALQQFIPHAYSRLAEKYHEDRKINNSERNLLDSKKELFRQKNILRIVENKLVAYVERFFDNDENARVPVPRVAGGGAPPRRVIARPDVVVPGEEDGAVPPGGVRAEDILAVFTGPAQIAAHYIERCAVEGGEPNRFDEYQSSMEQVKSIAHQIKQSSPEYIENEFPQILQGHLESRIEQHSENIGSSIARNRQEGGYIELLKKHFWSPHGFLLEHPVSKKFAAYEKTMHDSVQDISNTDNLHLPTLIENIVPESISMIDLFEDQIAKAAASIQENMTKESALPDVGKLEAELEAERSRLQALREKRVEEEKIMAEKFRQSEMARIEQERIAQEKLEQANMERIAAEELRIQQEQEAAEKLRIETEKAAAARFAVEQQKIEFHKERIELQNKKYEDHSDSLSEASELDVEEHEGWGEGADKLIALEINKTEALEDTAEKELISKTSLTTLTNLNAVDDDASSVFSDFSLDLEDE